MTLTKKVLILLCSLFLLFGIVQYLVQELVVFPSFVELEESQAQTDINRVIAAIENNMNQLDLLTHDWAAWNESYQFIKDKNQVFINDNLHFPSFVSAELNLIFFVDIKKQLIWGEAYNLQTGKQLIDKHFIKNFMDEIIPSINISNAPAKPEGKNLSTFFIYQNQPIFISVRPILTSENEGPINGYLIMGRLFDDPMKKQLVEQTKLKINFQPLVQKKSPSNYHIETLNSRQLKITTTMIGLEKEHGLKIEILLSRDITQNGRISLNFAIISLFVAGLIFISILGYLLNASIIGPLKKLTLHITEVFSQKNYSLRLNSRKKDEIGMLAQNFDDMLGKIEEDNLKLIDIASTDNLTQLFNRHKLKNVLENEWQQSARDRLPLSILMMDVDYFKLYNDHYGHQSGDFCLQKIAKILKNCVSRPADLVARYGGEEFIIVLHNTDAKGALYLASKIKEKLLNEAILHEQSDVSQWVTMSIGAATMIPSHNICYEELIEQADKALYQSKENGRDKINCY